MPRLLAFQHIDGEHPAAFGDLAAAAGDDLTLVPLHRGAPVPDLAGFDMLLVMGGPMDVWQTDLYPWLRDEIAAIAGWVGAGRPYLGVCLGHQLLARAMGGVCATMATPEIGIAPVTTLPDPLWGGLPAQFDALHWHGVEVSRLPSDAVSLAGNAACGVQAMRVGACAYGVQFHPEITAGLVTGWMQDPANRTCAVQWLGSEARADSFAAMAEAHVPMALRQSAALYGRLRDCALRKI